MSQENKRTCRRRHGKIWFSFSIEICSLDITDTVIVIDIETLEVASTLIDQQLDSPGAFPSGKACDNVQPAIMVEIGDCQRLGRVGDWKLMRTVEASISFAKFDINVSQHALWRRIAKANGVQVGVLVEDRSCQG